MLHFQVNTMQFFGEKMHVLVTGAAGFIGFSLCRYLAKNGIKVLGLDNFNNYYDVNLKRQREQILKSQKVDIIEADIRNTELLKKIIKEHEITHVANLAAQAGVRHSLLFPKDYIDSNLEGFISVLEACKLFPDIKIVYASSSSVYGENKKIPFSVHDRTDSPTNLYGATKKANELIAHAYHHLFNMPLIGLRYFTVYGPWGRPDMAYFKFTEKILNDKPIDVFGYGKMKRDFTYIDDIIDGTVAALNSDMDYGVFNLGNNYPVSVLELIETIEQNLQKKAKTNMLPMQPGEVHETFADISESQKQLNFSPKYSLDKGIKKFTEWYRSYYSFS